MTVQVCLQNLTAPDKIRCGDHVLHEVLGPRRMHFVALSDGVGTHSHDWAASEMACRTARDAFLACDGSTPDRLERAVRLAHQAVQNLEGKAAGATATLILLTWTEGEDRARFIGVGDSRLYRITVAGVECLTRDDTLSVPVRIDGELVLDGGSVKFTPGLTRAVGYASLGDIEIEDVDFRNGDMLAAVTDGFHELSGFEGRLGAVYDAIDPEAGIRRELVATHGVHGRDDASLVMLRRAGSPEGDHDEYLSIMERGLDAPEGGKPKHLMLWVCLDRMIELAECDDHEGIVTITGYMRGHGLAPTRALALPLLDLLAESNQASAKAALDSVVSLVR